MVRTGHLSPTLVGRFLPAKSSAFCVQPRFLKQVRTLHTNSITNSNRAERRSDRRSSAPDCRTSFCKQQTRSFHSTHVPRKAKRDAYKVLGVEKNATASDIKKAYYKLARDFHPDTSKDPSAKEKFIEVQEAYDILSDDSKRANYDNFGHAAFTGEQGPTGAGGFGGGFGGGFNGFAGFGAGGGNPFGAGGIGPEIFEQLFGAGFGGPRSGAAGGRSGFDAVARPINVNMQVPFMDAAKGSKRSITFEAIQKCKPCSGSGLKPGEKLKRCSVCGGNGQISYVRGGYHMSTMCDACGGAGSRIPPESKCNTCDGIGRVKGRRTVEIQIPPGSFDGLELRLQGQGNAPLEGDGRDGDLFVRLKVQEHHLFKRDGPNIKVEAEVPLEKALLGGSIRIPTIDGEVELTIPPGTQPMEQKRLKQRGVAKLDGRPGDRGDQYVTLRVKLPKHLTAEQRKLLEQAFGARSDKASSSQ
ncbi:uncharacterized protein EV422DRAFT_77333 [Fimicolochytrium jonesii]|uniref:uncharacterized protein n=1 Tax=Fimicolochytrium jonesii TaxID=1396493 RepID=UPI0022FEAAB3|nr:uncharacterized protein EV422DRAFT_77333 [Fimicolochytrium jonesii]KAI8820588.1 hypothetical protein EV422DRAFT_77333 [Fimicolochytrium jonesii]